MLSLLASDDIRGVLKHAGLEVEQLDRLGRYGGTVALKLGGLAQKGKQGVSPTPARPQLPTVAGHYAPATWQSSLR